MISLLITFPDINPVALDLGILQVRWYSLAYIVGIILAWVIALKIYPWFPDKKLNKAIIDSLLTNMTLAIIIGGRLGYVFFYNPIYYIYHPVDIVKVWQGGMSYHGALFGIILTIFWFSKKHKLITGSLLDLIAVTGSLGIFFGRVANFINGELWGRPTLSQNYGMIFPHVDQQPRHPSQLYEAFLEGLLIWMFLILLAKKTKILRYPGFIGGLYLILYGSARIFIEALYRVPEIEYDLGFMHITQGQVFSYPMLILGAFLIYLSKRKKYNFN